MPLRLLRRIPRELLHMCSLVGAFDALGRRSSVSACSPWERVRPPTRPSHHLTPGFGPSAAALPEGLRATVRAGKDRGTIAVEYRNEGSAPVEIEKHVLESPELALTFVGADEPVVPGPPPMPPKQVQTLTLQPGGVRVVTYVLTRMSPPLKSGRYQIRVAIAGWESNELEFLANGNL